MFGRSRNENEMKNRFVEYNKILFNRYSNNRRSLFVFNEIN